MATDAAGMAAKRAARKAAGLCTECESPRLEGHSVCQRHFDMRRQRIEEYNQKRRARKLCYCGSPVKPGRDRCPACLAIEGRRQTRRLMEHREAGLCLICGRRPPRRRKATCAVCGRKQAASYLATKERRLRKVKARARRGQLLRILAPSD